MRTTCWSALTVLVVVPMFNFAGHRLFTFSRS